MAQVFIFVSLYFVVLFHLDFFQCYNVPPLKPNISPECELKGICDSVENYPTELVEELIEKLQSKNTIFDYDAAPLPSINSRFNDIDEEPTSLCETNLRYIPVQAARDMKGKWQYIINDSKNPLQVFRTEICSKRMEPCSRSVSFGPGYVGACIQKMVLREMFYVNETNGIGKTYFEVPVCCSCSLFRKDNDY